MPSDQQIHDIELEDRRVEYDPGQAPGQEVERRLQWEYDQAVEQQQYAAAFLRQATKQRQEALKALHLHRATKMAGVAK